MSNSSYTYAECLKAALSYIANRYGGAAAMPADGFSAEEWPLAAGSVFGVRYWALDMFAFPARETRLTGARREWQPGENLARCLVTPGRAPEHKLPVAGCGCGFWAYWAPQYAPPLSVVGAQVAVAGVVEGYGRTIIGSKGFRCAKAKIAALHVLPEYVSPYMDEVTRVSMEAALIDTFQVPVYSTMATMLKARPTSRPEQEPPELDYRYASAGGTPFTHYTTTTGAYGIQQAGGGGGGGSSSASPPYLYRQQFQYSPAPAPEMIGVACMRPGCGKAIHLRAGAPARCACGVTWVYTYRPGGGAGGTAEIAAY